MSTLDQEADGRLWYHAKGAPLELLERCSTVRGADHDRVLSGADRDTIAATFESYARRGLRVLGFAERQVDRDRPGSPRAGRIRPVLLGAGGAGGAPASRRG